MVQYQLALHLTDPSRRPLSPSQHPCLPFRFLRSLRSLLARCAIRLQQLQQLLRSLRSPLATRCGLVSTLESRGGGLSRSGDTRAPH